MEEPRLLTTQKFYDIIFYMKKDDKTEKNSVIIVKGGGREGDYDYGKRIIKTSYLELVEKEGSSNIISEFNQQLDKAIDAIFRSQGLESSKFLRDNFKKMFKSGAIDNQYKVSVGGNWVKNIEKSIKEEIITNEIPEFLKNYVTSPPGEWRWDPKYPLVDALQDRKLAELIKKVDKKMKGEIQNLAIILIGGGEDKNYELGKRILQLFYRVLQEEPLPLSFIEGIRTEFNFQLVTAITEVLKYMGMDVVSFESLPTEELKRRYMIDTEEEIKEEKLRLWRNSLVNTINKEIILSLVSTEVPNFLREYANSNTTSGWTWNPKYPLVYALKGGDTPLGMKKGKLTQLIKNKATEIYEFRCKKCDSVWVSLYSSLCPNCKEESNTKEKIHFIKEAPILVWKCRKSSEISHLSWMRVYRCERCNSGIKIGVLSSTHYIVEYRKCAYVPFSFTPSGEGETLLNEGEKTNEIFIPGKIAKYTGLQKDKQKVYGLLYSYYHHPHQFLDIDPRKCKPIDRQWKRRKK